MQVLSFLVAIYAAIVSTYTAFKWLIENRPYIEIRKAPSNRSGTLFAAVHNPGRQPIFVIGSSIPKRQATGTNSLLNVTPYRESGISDLDEIAALFSGKVWWIAPPGSSVLFTIGPIYLDTDATVILKWHRGQVAWPRLQNNWQKITNPLRIHVTATMVESLNTYGFLS